MENIENMKWTKFVQMLVLFACFIGLVAVSFYSFFQTENAFRPFNDESMDFGGVVIGGWISFFFALIIQYGQNLALFANKFYCKGKLLFEVMDFEVTDKTLAIGAFVICAFVDAITNVVWFYSTVHVNSGNQLIDICINVIGYVSMVLFVFVEEVLGIALDALAKARKAYFDVVKVERKKRETEKRIETGTASSPASYRPNTQNRPEIANDSKNQRYAEPNYSRPQNSQQPVMAKPQSAGDKMRAIQNSGKNQNRSAADDFEQYILK